MTGAGVLVIGYGNPLRSDDGVGWHAASLLATDARPETLAALAKALYGGAPPMVLVSVTAGSLAEGDGLSNALQQALPEVVEAVAGIVTGQPS